MGFLSSLFGSSSKQSAVQQQTQRSRQKTDSTRTADQTIDVSRTGEKTLEQDATSEQASLTKLLADPELDVLTTLLADLAGGARAGATPDITSLLGETATAARALGTRAAGSEDFVNATIQPILADARRTGSRKVERITTNAAQRAGGTKLNSLVTATEAEASAQLESDLARLEAELKLAGRKQGSEELTSALQGLLSTLQAGGVGAAGVEGLGQIASVLKGATQEVTATGATAGTGRETTTEAENQVMRLVDILDQLIESRGSSTTIGAGKAAKQGPIFSPIRIGTTI